MKISLIDPPKRRIGHAFFFGLPVLGALPLAAAVLCLLSCGPVLQQADIEGFIETGLTNVLLRSAAFKSGSGTLSRAVSGQTLTCSLAIINPKSFDVSYALGWDVDDTVFTTRPPTAPVPSDKTNLAFSFVLNPSAAEHKTITFILEKYVASLNKTYDKETFSILCDSPPNPAARVATVMDSDQKSTLAVLLPTEASDDDLSSLKITWSMEGSTTTKTAVYAISALSALQSANPFSSKYDCYFQAPDLVAGYGYAYAVTVIDAAGQESGAVTTASTANSFYVNYKGNGNTSGSAPASVGYRFAATATVNALGDLAKTNYAFSKWNTATDGSGTSYSPGDTFTVPAGDVTLYAQWVGNSTGVTVGTPTNYQALTFADSAPAIAQGDAVSFETNNSTLDAVTTGWTWDIDGIAQSETSQKLTLSSAATATLLGSYLITARVTYAGVTYSGSLTLTVHR